MLVMVGIALVGMTLTPPAVRAEERTSQDVHDDTMMQVALCEAGGKAEVEVDRTVQGIESSKVTCRGGFLGDIQCFNGKYGDPFCISTDALTFETGLPTWQVIDVIHVLETGTNAEFHELQADLETAPEGAQDVAPLARDQERAAQSTAASADDQDQRQDTTKRKGKHGKKGGRGRKQCGRDNASIPRSTRGERDDVDGNDTVWGPVETVSPCRCVRFTM